MHVLIGQMTLWLALLLAAVALIAALAAAFRRDGLSWTAARDSLMASSAMALASTATLLAALIQNDFSLAYVAANSEIQMPLVYRVSALWRDSSGSMLLWAAMLAVGAIIYLMLYRRRPSRLHALVIAAISAQMILLLGLMTAAASPFIAADAAGVDGAGMRLMLQVWAMTIHPPLTFAAYAALGIAAAISIAALATGKLRESLSILRTALLTGWLTMTLGIAIGAYWAYTDLGWGNYWSWDPVENSSLVPWLLATAALHTLRIAPSGRLLKATHIFTIFTLVACLLATFIARGGVPTDSRHSYAPSPIANAYLAFIVFMLLVTALLLIVDRRRRRERRPRLNRRTDASATRSDSDDCSGSDSDDGSGNSAGYVNSSKTPGPTSASAVMTVSAGVLVLFAVAIVIGTIGPGLVSTGQPAQQSSPDAGSQMAVARFDRLGAVFGVILLAVLGGCPWLMRARQSRLQRLIITNALFIALLGVLGVVEGIAWLWVPALSALGAWIIGGQLYRLINSGMSRRTIAATMAHLALIMLAASLVVSHNLSRQWETTLNPADYAGFGSLGIRFDELERQPIESRREFRTTAHLTLLHEGREIARLSPSHLRRLDRNDHRDEVALKSGIGSDIMISLTEFDETGRSKFIVRQRPGIIWIWISSALLAIAAAIALTAPSPGRRKRQEES